MKLVGPMVIKGKLFLLRYELLWVVQYGELYLDFITYNFSQHHSYISLWQVGRINVKIFGPQRVNQTLFLFSPHSNRIYKKKGVQQWEFNSKTTLYKLLWNRTCGVWRGKRACQGQVSTLDQQEPSLPISQTAKLNFVEVSSAYGYCYYY